MDISACRNWSGGGADLGWYWKSTSLLDGDLESNRDGDLDDGLDRGLQLGRGGWVRGGDLLLGCGGDSCSARMQSQVVAGVGAVNPRPPCTKEKEEMRKERRIRGEAKEEDEAEEDGINEIWSPHFNIYKGIR